MVTVIVAAVLVAWLFVVFFEEDAASVPGFFLGFVIGLLLAIWIGTCYPTKMTININEPIEQLVLAENEQNVFYLQRDEENKRYYFMLGGETRSLSDFDVEIVYESNVTPYVLYTKTEFDRSQGKNWMWLFGISNLPRENIVIHLPQGSIYFIQPEK